MHATTARHLVASRIARRARSFPQVFPQRLDTAGLSARDAALARAIDQAVARRWLTLAAVLESQLSRPWDRLQPAVKGALLAGAAQLLLLERLPDHAVVNESVAWVKRRSPAAGRLVNAVLHRVADLRRGRSEGTVPPPWPRRDLPLHDGRVLHLGEPVFGEDPWRRLGEQTSHPPGLLSAWVERYGPDAATRLAWHDLVHPPVIVAGVAAGADAALADHDDPGFAVLDGGPAELDALLERQPQALVQDPAAAAAVAATAGLAPALIVEVCAGRGTKTRQLERVHPGARIVASDASPHRLTGLRKLFAGDDRVSVVEPQDLPAFAGRADLVVVDPPCSNTAVLARRVEAKYRYGRETLGPLEALQRQILADAVRLLAASGRLLYSTCSLEPQENEHQLAWARRWHRLHADGPVGLRPRGVPGDPPGRYRDGCFFGVLDRR